MSFRRFHIKYTDFNQLETDLLTSSVYIDLLGAACDEKLKTVYVSLSKARSIASLKALPWVRQISQWDSKDHIKTFAEKNNYLFIPGPSENKEAKTADEGTLNIKRRMIAGEILDDIEEKFFLLEDVNSLDCIYKSRGELAKFQGFIGSIKKRIGTDESEIEPNKFRKLESGNRESQKASVLRSLLHKLSK